MQGKRIAIVGAAGVPANYGGFETLSENLVRFHHEHKLSSELLVYCSSKRYPQKQEHFLTAQLKYVPLNANGIQSILYDIWSIISAILNRCDVILLLGVSGGIALPFIRLFSSASIITNIDGIEWRRKKWKGLAKMFLRLSERIAIRNSTVIIADNPGIAEYVREEYGRDPEEIAYGGDHAIKLKHVEPEEIQVPDTFSLSVCRIEPENNVHRILEAFAGSPSNNLVFIGNWDENEYGRNLKEKYSRFENISIVDPIYDPRKLAPLRSRAKYYLHGHSAGGTNPSLVEAMFFGRPIISYDCVFNRYTTENKATYFKTADDLSKILKGEYQENSGLALMEVAKEKYTIEKISQQYFSLFAHQETQVFELDTSKVTHTPALLSEEPRSSRRGI